MTISFSSTFLKSCLDGAPPDIATSSIHSMLDMTIALLKHVNMSGRIESVWLYNNKKYRHIIW